MIIIKKDVNKYKGEEVEKGEKEGIFAVLGEKILFFQKKWWGKNNLFWGMIYSGF